MNIFLTIAALSAALAVQWQHYFLHSSRVKFLGSCFPLVQYCSKWVSGHSCSTLVWASHMQELIIGVCLCNLFISIGWSLLLWSIMVPFPTSHANDDSLDFLPFPCFTFTFRLHWWSHTVYQLARKCAAFTFHRGPAYPRQYIYI